MANSVSFENPWRRSTFSRKLIVAIVSLVSGAAVAEGISASGGIITLDGDYEVHTFLSNGTFSVSGSAMVDVLVVGGGGGGGAGYGGGGGGGGGGVIYRQSVQIDADDYPIVVGAGGAGTVVEEKSWPSYVAPRNGGVSSAFGIEALGGGAGGNFGSGGKPGASGGGGSNKANDSTDTSENGGAGTEGQGFVGGKGVVTSGLNRRFCGGGGGASEPGHDGAYPVTATSGDGGDGFLCSITGRERYYGGGGGGGTSNSGYGNYPTQGGKGGGGVGGGSKGDGKPGYSGKDGEAGTGGGGGGGGGYTPYSGSGGDGGSGVVIIRIRKGVATWAERFNDAEGGVKTCMDGFHIHTFNEDGEFTMPVRGVVDALIVGGGGGGGGGRGGGGGGGEVVVVSNLVLDAGSYAITIGAGGEGQKSASGKSGSPSSFFVYKALGGGGGGYTNKSGLDGASGGGGGGSNLGKSAGKYLGG